MPSQSYLAFNLIFFWTSQCMACFCFELTHVDQPMSCFPREVSVVWLPSFHDSYFGHNIKLVFSFHFVFLLFLFCLLFIDITIIILFFLYNSRSKVMLMLTSTSSRNIQLLHFFFYFPQKNWPYNLRDMNIIWQTMFTTGSNEARELGHSQETMRKTNPSSCHMASQ